DDVGEKLDHIGSTPLKISTEVANDDVAKDDGFGSEVIKVYIFKAEAEDDVEIGCAEIADEVYMEVIVGEEEATSLPDTQLEDSGVNKTFVPVAWAAAYGDERRLPRRYEDGQAA
ncbi:hypothetical protein HGM15179_022308, partial [Zosterops borbonicus]